MPFAGNFRPPEFGRDRRSGNCRILRWGKIGREPPHGAHAQQSFPRILPSANLVDRGICLHGGCPNPLGTSPHRYATAADIADGSDFAGVKNLPELQAFLATLPK